MNDKTNALANGIAIYNAHISKDLYICAKQFDKYLKCGIAHRPKTWKKFLLYLSSMGSLHPPNDFDLFLFRDSENDLLTFNTSFTKIQSSEIEHSIEFH